MCAFSTSAGVFLGDTVDGWMKDFTCTVTQP